ncbi:MAG: cytochrome c [Acidobacteria bacterium]|nr:cytochrome c [Acidobacteriota bacterium]
MQDQPKYEPLEQSDFFADGRAARPIIDGTVARGHLNDDEVLYTGKDGGAPVEAFPVAISHETLERGRERFDIYCAPCHDRLGNGDGMIVRRGYRRPPSLHVDRLRAAPPGHFFDVMTNGFGAMPDYRHQISVPDRWAIVAYIRALQLSQRATIADVPAGRRRELERQQP